MSKPDFVLHFDISLPACRGGRVICSTFITSLATEEKDDIPFGRDVILCPDIIERACLPGGRVICSTFDGLPE
jgi:hypothetical protein